MKITLAEGQHLSAAKGMVGPGETCEVTQEFLDAHPYLCPSKTTAAMAESAAEKDTKPAAKKVTKKKVTKKKVTKKSGSSSTANKAERVQ